MSVAVDVSRDGVTVPVAATRVREIVQTVCLRERVREAMISVTFVTSRAMARLNREYLSHRGSTDIITFELQKVAGVVIGDMYICPDVARENARVHRRGIREEILRLVVHGTLHVLGHTHPDDADARLTSPMWRKQERLVASFA